jgi:inhibitor of cysteine peptidase
MNRRIARIRSLALAGMLALLAACAPLTVTEQNNGSSVKLSPGRSLLVQLYANPSTGYNWEVAGMDSALLRLNKTTAVQPPPHNPPIVGAPETMILEFQALARGHTALKLVYHRPWEQNTPPEQTYVLDVNID